MRSFPKLLALAPTLMLACCTNLSSPAPPPALTPPSTPTAKATGATDPLCVVLRPVELSHADTDGTKAQVIELNSVIDKVCAGK